ncbi:MAG: hypothetical protein LBI04_10665 [Treponema sp.]|nr:hypothetical protein [Treponema sp.]
MKKRCVFGFIAMIIIAITVLAGCGGVNDNTGNPRINISGASYPDPKVGDKIRASGSGGKFINNSDYIWEFSDKRDSTRWAEIKVVSYYDPYYHWVNYGYNGTGTLSGQNDQEFTIGEGLEGFYLRAKRKAEATDDMPSDWVYSTILGRIQAAAVE